MQVLYCLQTDFQGNEFGWERTRFHGLLPFTVPHDGCTIQEYHMTGMGPPRIFILRMGSVDKAVVVTPIPRGAGIVCGSCSLASRWISVKSSCFVLNSPKSSRGNSGDMYNVNFGCLHRNAKTWSNCSKCPSLGFAWNCDSIDTLNRMLTLPISVAHRRIPISS